jgi:hypothetical protein
VDIPQDQSTDHTPRAKGLSSLHKVQAWPAEAGFSEVIACTRGSSRVKSGADAIGAVAAPGVAGKQELAGPGTSRRFDQFEGLCFAAAHQ